MRKFINVVRLKENDRLDELNPLGRMAKAKDTTLAKMGRQKSQRAVAASGDAEVLWGDWKKATIDAGLNPTLPTLVKWLDRQGIESDVLQAGFKGIGIDNDELNRYMSAEGGEEVEAEEMPDEGDTITGKDDTVYTFDGENWKSPEGGVLKPKFQDIATKKWREGSKDEVETEEKITVNSTPVEAIRILQDKYGLKNREIIGAFKEADIDYKSDDPIGKENIVKLVQVLKAANVKPTDDAEAEPEGGEATGETLTTDMEAQGKEIGDATIEDFTTFVKREKGASDEQAAAMVDAAGISGPTIGDDGAQELAKVVDQAEKSGEIAQEEPEEEAGGGGAESIIAEFEGSARSGALKRARRAAKEAKAEKGGNLENNLAKLGAAFLVANKMA